MQTSQLILLLVRHDATFSFVYQNQWRREESNSPLELIFPPFLYLFYESLQELTFPQFAVFCELVSYVMNTVLGLNIIFFIGNISYLQYGKKFPNIQYWIFKHVLLIWDVFLLCSGGKWSLSVVLWTSYWSHSPPRPHSTLLTFTTKATRNTAFTS